MKVKYDNLEDAKSKLLGTYCYYKRQAVLVKTIEIGADGIYYASVYTLSGNHRKTITLDDPDFNCSDFNIGYVNYEGAAIYFYRVPGRQYRQGIRGDQLGAKASQRHYLDHKDFNMGRHVSDMMENIYPRPEECERKLKEEGKPIVAFHKNFAATWDRLHSDYILEYKGQLIGHTKDWKRFELMEEHLHLTEALKEAVN